MKKLIFNTNLKQTKKNLIKLFSQKQNQSNQSTQQAKSQINNTANIVSNEKSSFKLKSKEEISIEYEDKTFFFKYQWSKIQKEKKQFFQDYLSPDFNNHQQLEIDSLYEIIKGFNSLEMILFSKETEKHANSYGKQGIFLKTRQNPELDPNFLRYQEVLYSLQPFLSSKYFLGGASQQVSKDKENQAKEAKEIKEEVKKEKVIVNVKYLGFDPSKKIGLIKEFRSIFGLGLKEAKESVETSPSILKKDVKREEAKELKEKLEAAGAKIEVE